MWSGPGYRIASLPSLSPWCPSQPQQLSFQSYPKITCPRQQIHPQHCFFLPPPRQAHPARGAASAAPLGTTALPFAAGMLAGEEAGDAGDAGDAGSKERGAQTTQSPSKEGHGDLSTHRCLTEPIYVQATCSPLQCPHLTHPSAPACCHRVLPSPQRPESY